MLESIIDSSFAEGTKNPIFFNFTLQQKQNYLVLLDSLGVEYVELCLQDIHDLIQFKNTSGLNIKFIIYINDSLDDNPYAEFFTIFCHALSLSMACPLVCFFAITFQLLYINHVRTFSLHLHD